MARRYRDRDYGKRRLELQWPNGKHHCFATLVDMERRFDRGEVSRIYAGRKCVAYRLKAEAQQSEVSRAK